MSLVCNKDFDNCLENQWWKLGLSNVGSGGGGVEMGLNRAGVRAGVRAGGKLLI
jgi:hypothetical protein